MPTTIYDLRMAATCIADFSCDQRASLLFRSMGRLQDVRHRLSLGDEVLPKGDEIVVGWQVLAVSMETVTDDDASAILRGAADILEAAQRVLDAKYEVILERAVTRGRA